MNLYALRYTHARGWHWKKEREVTKDNGKDWLKVFQDDEPLTSFKISVKPPKSTARA